jgi:hypothetical protein
VTEERSANLRELLVGEARQIDAADFRPHRGGEGMNVDMLVVRRAIVELAGGMNEHGQAPLRDPPSPQQALP